MKQAPTVYSDSNHGGFSLIEVVMALGIVAFALLAIFALFSNSLRSASETVSQHEVLGITRSLGDYLRSTNNTNSDTNSGRYGYNEVSNWAASPNSVPGLFAYVSNNGTVTIGLSNSIASSASSLTNRAGRLFRLVPTLSSSVPGITNAANLSTNTFIPLQIKIYEVSSVGASTNNLLPVFTYETSVFR